MSYDYRNKKTIIVLASNLSTGVAGNVIGHLALSIGRNIPSEDMGREKLVDATGFSHLGISKYPVIVTKVKPGRLRKLITEARNHDGIILVDYPEEMLSTGHDDELAEALALKNEASINYLGAAIHATRQAAELLAGKFTLWGNTNKEESEKI